MPQKAKPGVKKTKYSHEQIVEALTALATNAGNVLATSKEINIPRKTLSQWRTIHAYDYEIIKGKLRDALCNRLVEAREKCLDALLDSLVVTRQMLRDKHDRVRVRCGDLAKTLEIIDRVQRVLSEENAKRSAEDHEPGDGDERLAAAIERLAKRHEQTQDPS